MVNSLHKVDFSHPTAHYTWGKIVPPPLEKILGAPLATGMANLLPVVNEQKYTRIAPPYPSEAVADLTFGWGQVGKGAR